MPIVPHPYDNTAAAARASHVHAAMRARSGPASAPPSRTGGERPRPGRGPVPPPPVSETAVSQADGEA